MSKQGCTCGASKHCEARTLRRGSSYGYLLLILFGHLALILHLQQDLLQLLVLLFQ